MEIEHDWKKRKKKGSALIFNAKTAQTNSPSLVNLKPVPTLTVFAYIPNMNSYTQGLLLGRRSVLLE